MANENPCIDICIFDGQTGWCLGCGQTREEARDWRKMKPYNQKQLLNDLPRRLKKLTDQGKLPL